MRYVLSILLLPALLSAALAQGNEAEKLYRDMEKKIRAADALELAFTYQIGFKATRGFLLMTKDNKVRLKINGHFGGTRKGAFELAANGKRLRTKGARLFIGSNGQAGVELGGQSEWETPNNFHAVLGTLVGRAGMWYSLHVMPYLREADIDPNGEESKMKAYDFKAGADDKVGVRQAKVVRYKFGKGDGCNDDMELTLWIDAETSLPLKRLLVHSKAEQIRVTEVYTEFKLNPKIDAKAFELPPAQADPDAIPGK